MVDLHVVGPKATPIFPFKVGEQYSRSEDIHKPFGGQMRGGICTPKSVPAVFLFTGKSGDQFGYVDKWNEDHTVYSFAGEGQEGDMGMKGGNRAIREHDANGKEIHLFEALGKGKPIRYMGRFDYINHQTIPGIDKHSAPRLVLIFDLVRYAVALPTANPGLLDRLTKRLANKHFTHPPAGQQYPEKVIQSGVVVYKRDPEVRAYVLGLAKGKCELCTQLAPFLDSTGAHFLEVHHVVRLARGGADTPANTVALCPNCHRRLHYSADALEATRKLYKANPRLGQQPIQLIGP
jgi:5-methylcytosine-specific restriction enzyme A